MKSELKKLAIFLAIGAETIILTVGGASLGDWASRHLGLHPLVALVLALAGFLISIYRAYLWNKKLDG